mmetsp:Transcript_55635/g.153552  ORF Transcript_55635/g.153552 Transcript_55635/m.153552 type:complete len:208 (+) Transcript_55635:294-917(+)
MAIFQRSARGLANDLPPSPRVLELGAGAGLPGLDLARSAVARGGGSVVLTDYNQPLVDLLSANADKLPEGSASVAVRTLDWADAAARAELVADGNVDLLIGSDVCYLDGQVPLLTEVIVGIGANVTVITAPLTRPALSNLAAALGRTDGVAVEEFRVALVSSDAAAKGAACDNGGRVGAGGCGAVGDGVGRYGAIFRVLVIRQGEGG